jgi:hypothetical protein
LPSLHGDVAVSKPCRAGIREDARGTPSAERLAVRNHEACSCRLFAACSYQPDPIGGDGDDVGDFVYTLGGDAGNTVPGLTGLPPGPMGERVRQLQRRRVPTASDAVSSSHT